MKRTAMQHTKLRRLVRALDVPQYAAVGILESLWHLTAREAPWGNIGKLSNEDIAAVIDWRGPADTLVNALVECGWLDLDTADRLTVHDWEHHYMDPSRHGYTSAKRFRRRERIRRAGGDLPKMIRTHVMSRDGHKCVTCDTFSDLTIDHIIPLSKGGTNAIHNLQVLCRRCNSRKKDRVFA